MAGYDRAAADCGTIGYSDKELWEAFDYLLEKGKKSACYKFVFLLGLFDELEKMMPGKQMPFPVAFRGFTGRYWQAMKDCPEYFTETHEVAARVIRDYMSVYGMDFAMLSLDVQTKLVMEITKKCQENVVGAACADLQYRVYGYDKAEQRMWFNASAYVFIKKHVDALRRKAEAGLAGFVAGRTK